MATPVMLAKPAPCGLWKLSSHLVGQKSRAPGAVARIAVSPRFHHSSNSQDVSKYSSAGAGSWMELISGTDKGKVVAPMATSAAFFLQDSAPALARVMQGEKTPEQTTATLITWGVFAVLYLFVIPGITYNYLRLRWYKRKLAETYFQFLLVFIFFPGMLLLAPFINFRPLPREGTEPP